MDADSESDEMEPVRALISLVSAVERVSFAIESVENASDCIWLTDATANKRWLVSVESAVLRFASAADNVAADATITGTSDAIAEERALTSVERAVLIAASTNCKEETAAL